jgi:hypothetical protein
MARQQTYPSRAGHAWGPPTGPMSYHFTVQVNMMTRQRWNEKMSITFSNKWEYQKIPPHDTWEWLDLNSIWIQFELVGKGSPSTALLKNVMVRQQCKYRNSNDQLAALPISIPMCTPSHLLLRNAAPAKCWSLIRIFKPPGTSLRQKEKTKSSEDRYKSRHNQIAQRYPHFSNNWSTLHTYI